MESMTFCLLPQGQKGTLIAELKGKLQSATVKIQASELADKGALAELAALAADCKELEQLQVWHSAFKLPAWCNKTQLYDPFLTQCAGAGSSQVQSCDPEE